MISRPADSRRLARSFICGMFFVFVIAVGVSHADPEKVGSGAAKAPVPANWGQKPVTSFNTIREGFANPDMVYAPFCFWFWDEPVDSPGYPEKVREMAREMLQQGINPGYAHPRVSMADLLGPEHMAPSPSLPKDQWLSTAWFEAFDTGLQEAEAAAGYFGYVDDYMWPMGRAAGRVFEAHPELANASLQWDIIDVNGGSTVQLPPSFYTVAARVSSMPDPEAFTFPVEESTFELANLTGADLFGTTSIGQTVLVARKRLDSLSVKLACWQQDSIASFTIEARLDGPEGRLIARRHVDESARKGDTVSLPIPELLPPGTILYVAMIPDPGYPEMEIGWWSKPSDVYAGGSAHTDGQPVGGDRFVTLSYLTQAERMQGQWIWHPDARTDPHTCYLRKRIDMDPGQTVVRALVRITADNRYRLFVNGIPAGQGDDWSRPGSWDVSPLLHEGTNVLAVEGGGDGGLDALLCDLAIDLTNGETLRISSDATWLVTGEAGEGWTTEAFDDSGWVAAREIGDANAPPWNLPEARAPYQQATVQSTTLEIIGSGEAFTWSAPTDGLWRVYSFHKVTGGDVNVLDERLAKAFIGMSHLPYVKRFGERMGKSIPGVFCDTEGSYGNGNGLAWSESLAPRYLATTGRDIRLWMPLMLDDDEEGLSARARFDWFEAVSDLYAGFYEETSDWLAGHGMYYIANVWEESLQWQASCVSDHMKVQRAFSMPGTDCLGLKAYDVHDFKETQSVSEFEGRRLQSEIMGAGGWTTYNPVTMKECTNAVIAWGVNHIVPHGVFMTRVLEGNVWVPDWYDRNPMWPNMRVWSDFARRAAFVNSQGRVEPDVLLLNPMDSVWALLGRTDKLWWSPEAGHVGYIDELYSQRVQDINAVYSEAMRQLTEHRVEYLIADRHYVRQMLVDGNQLVRGEFAFKTVVIPPMTVLPLDVAEKVVAFARAGGLVYTLGDLPAGSTDNGLNDPAMAALMHDLQAQPNFRACAQGLAHELDAKSPGLTSPIQFVSGEFPMLQQRRRIDHRDFFWLVNNSVEVRQCEIRTTGVTGGASVWDCETGAIRPVAVSPEGTGMRIQLAFQPHEAYWLVLDPQQPTEFAPVMALPDGAVLATVGGSWQVRVDPKAQPNLEHAVTLPAEMTRPEGVTHALTLWNTWTELPENFSGLIDYTKTITLPEFTGELALDLGENNHFAEAWVNGAPLGARLWPPHRFRTDAFRPGPNEIRIRVGNLVNNNYGIESPSGLVGPVTIREETSRNEETGPTSAPEHGGRS